MDDALIEDIETLVRRMLDEDVGPGDVTAALLDGDSRVAASIITRQPMVLAGIPWASRVFAALDDRIGIEWRAADGDRLAAGDELCAIAGPARALMTGERAALNILQTLSATATETARYVDAVRGTGCRILDTRKTLPGLRLAQKYAVRCGGGTNHRTGLFDAVLIKENHILACGGIKNAVSRSRTLNPGIPVEVEVESLDELREALAAGVERVLLDNFGLDELRAAVATNRLAGTTGAELEASGNVTLETIRAIAATGVDFISVGALTKNVQAVDLSMRVAGG